MGTQASTFPVNQNAAIPPTVTMASSPWAQSCPWCCYLALPLGGKGLRKRTGVGGREAGLLVIIPLRAQGVENKVRAPRGKGPCSDPRGPGL
jgi:hypothetical protein